MCQYCSSLRVVVKQQQNKEKFLELAQRTKAGGSGKKKTFKMAKITTNKTRKHVNRQQLSHLWCWLIIIATNLFSSCSLTQAFNSNESNKNLLATKNPILLVDTASTNQNNATNKTAAVSTLNNTAHAFDTEIQFKAAQHLRNAAKIKEIENKPVEMNVRKYHNSSSAPWPELSEKFITWPNYSIATITSTSTTATTTTAFTTAIEWLNLTDVVSSNDYLSRKATPDQTESGSLFSTTSLTSFNHSDTNFLTYHEECLANSNNVPNIFTVLLYSVVCTVGLFGNTLVIWVVLRFSKMQTVTNIYILNLAIADECFLIGIPFLLYTMRICSWKFGDYMCKAYMVSTSITQFTSSIFLLIMAADRYIAVCHAIESTKYRTLRIAKLVSILAWFTSVVLMMPVILFANTVRQADGIHFSCNIDWPEDYKKHSGTTFILYTFLLGFATPLCFILVFYYLVIRKLRSVQQKHKSKEKKRSHRKVTRLVLTVITVYILCWLPHWVSQVSLISAFMGQRELSNFEILLFLLFGCLAYSNSAMNPILYAFLSDNFRKSFTRAFTCMNRHEVEAQLMNEHSVLTHKRTASGCKSKNSKNLMAQKTAAPIQHNNAFLTPTIAPNSGGGCSTAGGSSSGGTSTSTATTATDKSSNITKPTNERMKNGDVLTCANTNEERIHMVVRHDQRSQAFKTALCEVDSQI